MIRRPIIGQEAICPQGLGRVSRFNSRTTWIVVYGDKHDDPYPWDLVQLVLLPTTVQASNEEGV